MPSNPRLRRRYGERPEFGPSLSEGIAVLAAGLSAYSMAKPLARMA